MCVEAEVKASAQASAARGPSASPAAGSRGVGIVSTIVVARHYYWDRVSVFSGDLDEFPIEMSQIDLWRCSSFAWFM
jgi:hypothetical protein